MDKHKPSDEMIKDLDNLLSKLNAMEIVASDEHQKSSVKAKSDKLQALVINFSIVLQQLLLKHFKKTYTNHKSIFISHAVCI